MNDAKIQKFLKLIATTHKETRFSTNDVLLAIREYFNLAKKDTASKYLEYMDYKRYIKSDKGIWVLEYCDQETPTKQKVNKPIPSVDILKEENLFLFLEIQSKISNNQIIFESDLDSLIANLYKYRKNLLLIKNQEEIK